MHRSLTLPIRLLKISILLPLLFLYGLSVSAQGIVVSVAITDHGGFGVSCNGGADGEASASVTGAIGSVVFAWSHGPSTPLVGSLSAGDYTVIATDSLNNADTLTITITQPPAVSVSLYSPSYNGFNVHCTGGADGQINATVSGGVAPYTYQWSNGGAVPNIGGLTAGTYQLIVTGANGCSDTASITLTAPSALLTVLASPLTASGYEIACDGSNSGSIDLTVSGGVGPFLYNWSNGAITEDLNGLGAGTYSIQVQDANGCVKYDSLEMRQPIPLVYTGSAYEYAPGEFFSCPTCTDGQATLTPSGGTQPYSYSWSNGQTTATATDLAPNTYYSFIITDAAGCTVVDSFLLTPNSTPNPLDVIGTVSSYPGGYQVSSNGAMDGWIDIQVNGGTPPFTYSWSNGQTTQDLFNLMAGTYTVTVTDANAEQVEKNFTLNQPSNMLGGVLSTLHPLCFGQATGFMEALVSGGTPPYTFEWSTIDGSPHANGSLMHRIENLGQGWYSVIVRDANNDSILLGDSILVPEPLLSSILPSVNVQGYHLLCKTGSSVLLDLQITGGRTPYSYQWDNGKFTQDITVTMEGWYMVQVTDDKGCVKVDSFLVSAPMDELMAMAQPYIYPNGTPFSCEVCNDAIVALNISGGIAPYNIQWTGAGTAQGDTLIDVPADSLIGFIVTDDLGCVVSDNGTIPRDPMAGQLEVMAELSNFPGGYNVSNTGAMDGEIKLTIVGGQAPYSVQWMHGPTTEDLFGLSAGYYEVTVTDNVGNMVTEGYTLTSPQNGLSVMLSGNYSSCNGSGNISAMVNGGTPPYSYVWSGPQGEIPGETWSSLMVYEPGLYTVQVSDANASNATSDITLSGGGGFTVELFSPAIYGSANASCSGTDGSIVVTITGGSPPYNITVNGWSNQTENQPPVAPIHQFITTSDQVITITDLRAGGYDIFVADMGNCGGESEFIELTSPPDLQVTTIAQEIVGGGYFSCETCSDGVVDAAVLNSTGPFSQLK